MSSDGVPNSNADESRWVGRLVRWGIRALVAGAVVTVGALVFADFQPGSPENPSELSVDSAAMMPVAPEGVLAAEDVPTDLKAHYHAAKSYPEIFENVPCFCGCEAMLGHRHLGDCFVRADGQGLEAHALGCGVCIGEAQQVMDLVADGITDPEQIRAAVIAVWSDPYLQPGT